MQKVVVAYVPVLHEGYRQFFEKHRDADRVYIWDDQLIVEFDHLKRKDPRRLSPHLAALSLRAWSFLPSVEAIGHETLNQIRASQLLVVMPDEEESRELAARHLAGCHIEFDRSIFLRWDRGRVLAEEEVQCDRIVSFEGFVAEMMRRALEASESATNLWRRVGAVIARDGEVLLTGYNVQIPSAHTPYYEGDPRMFFKRGLHYELTTDEHAEARLVAEAANEGIRLRGSDLFITTFPCPPCAKLVVTAGIRRIYFLTGYAQLDGERRMRESGVEIIQVVDAT